MSDRSIERHLEPPEIAAFVDRVATAQDRARIASHLAACAECREEIANVSDLVADMRRSRHTRYLWIPAAAAAAVVLMLAWPRNTQEPSRLAHRESPVTTTVAPVAIAPLGVVDSVKALVWSAVPNTDRYHVRVFDAEGAVLWERQTTDTTVVLPATVLSSARRTYNWKVEAQTGFDRRAASELVEFSLRGTRRP